MTPCVGKFTSLWLLDFAAAVLLCCWDRWVCEDGAGGAELRLGARCLSADAVFALVLALLVLLPIIFQITSA